MLTKEQIEQEALTLVEQEVEKYKHSQFQVTSSVSFNIRPLIERCRKNYWGIFDKEKDPNTKRKKQWVPLTRVLVDGAFKNSDVDSKDVSFRATPQSGAKGRRFTNLVRGFMRDWLDRNYYGQVIDQDRLQMIIDGTLVWKTWKAEGRIKRRTVDILNVFIDPVADSIQEAYRFTERALMTEQEVKGMDWDNVDDVEVKDGLDRESGVSTVKVQGEYVDVYEMWGKIPQKLITGNEDDDMEIDGRIVVSGFDTGNPLVHVIDENKEKDAEGNIIKPYEEAWYLKVPGRWYGVGIPESVLYLQEWINLVVNLRINRNTLSQLGLIKWRRRDGQDISQQMVNSLVSSGIVPVDDPDDITNLAINPADAQSYQDEEVVQGWAQKVTSIFDTNLGAPTPASVSATGEVIRNRESKSAFVLVKESWGQFQQRWIDRHVMKHIPQMMKKAGFATVFGDVDNIQEIRKAVAAHLAMEKLEEMFENGQPIPDEASLLTSMDEIERRLQTDKDLFFEVVEDVVAKGLYTKVYFTNEEIDAQVTVRNLVDIATQLVPDQNVRNDLIAQAMDLMNLPVPASLQQPMSPQSQALQMPKASGVLDNLNAQTEMTTQDNTGAALGLV